MRDLLITFSESGTTVHTDRTTSGFDATVQASCVCLATTRGTSAADPDKGTRLVERLLVSGISGRQARQHQLAFAALDVQFFLNARKETKAGERISSLVLQETGVAHGQLDCNLLATGEKGSIVGVDLQVHVLP